MVDISAYNTKILIKATGFFGSGVSIDPKDFSVDSQPLSITSVNLSKMDIDLNGHPVINGYRPAIHVSIALIPGSHSDKALMDFLYMMRAGHSSYKLASEIPEMSIQYPSGAVLTLKFGCLVRGSVGANISRDGKFIGGTYDFEFATWQEIGTGSGKSLNVFSKNAKANKN